MIYNYIDKYIIGDENGECASPEDIEKLKSFLIFLNSNNTHEIIYRGDDLKELFNRFKVYDDLNFNQYLFLIGDKGKVYRKKFKETISDKTKIYPLNSTEKYLFERIFNKFNMLFRKKDSARINMFKGKNNSFCNYFLNKENRADFLSKITTIKNRQDKLKIRDYYLALLHNIGKIGFYSNSFFLSTSLDFNVALSFAKNNDSDEPIIFVSWIRDAENSIGITREKIENTKSILDKLELPRYRTSFYPEQKEVLVKGGLLPHYVLGYLKINERKFVINPHFINSNNDFKDIANYGFDIDQSKFSEILSKTEFDGYFTLSNGTFWDDNNPQ
jgi:hypothetical protein